MSIAVIISGGDINYDFALGFLERTSYEYLIGADKGIHFLRRAQLIPTHIVGDFDSSLHGDLNYFKGHTGAEVRAFCPEKDFTDTQIAVELALELKSTCIYILGGTSGKRADHLLANIRVLGIPLKRGAECCLLDAYNKIYLKDTCFTITREEQFGKYISLFALGRAVKGLTLEGCYYPLNRYQMQGNDPIGVSNEMVSDFASISFEDGVLIVVESRE